MHHGNGTQDTFYTTDRWASCRSTAGRFIREPARPTKRRTGAGLGTIVNLPTEFGTPRSEYIQSFRSALEKLADKTRPQLVIVERGFDSHRDDPVGSLELETEDFIELSRIVLRGCGGSRGGSRGQRLGGRLQPVDFGGLCRGALDGDAGRRVTVL